MNDALMNTATIQDRQAAAPPTRVERTWIILICAILGLSGGARYWREWRFQGLSKESEKPPFPLKEFPMQLGDGWSVLEGSETILEPEVRRLAGAKDYLIRTYTNKNGETLDVMILYGLAQIVWPHTPSVCYPAAGYRLMTAPRDVDIPIPGSSATAQFREEDFARYKAGIRTYQQVYHSFRHAGRWEVDISNKWKSFRFHPGIFKVQIQRRVETMEKIDNRPMEEFVGVIVEEIERRLKANGLEKPQVAIATDNLQPSLAR
jgi:hypothetical protein